MSNVDTGGMKDDGRSSDNGHCPVHVLLGCGVGTVRPELKVKLWLVGLILAVLTFAGALLGVALYVNNGSQRCAEIGAEYWGPGLCRYVQERQVPMP